MILAIEENSTPLLIVFFLRFYSTHTMALFADTMLEDLFELQIEV